MGNFTDFAWPQFRARTERKACKTAQV